ncbi:MAG: Spy/CpxP family protein refolding chaperone [Terracidiphilus sp.]
MRRTIARRLVLAMAGVMVAGGLAAAQGPGMGSGFGDHRPPMERAFRFDGAHGQFWNNPRIVEKLKLTDDQRKAMDGILQDHKVTLVDLRASEEKAELEMQPLMRADQPNENAILAQIDKIAQARAELEKANARFLLAIRSKLTADQWKQVQQFREDHGQDRGPWGRDGNGPGMRGRGMHGPGGQFHRQGPPPAPPAGQQGAPAPQAPGSGDTQ